ncbi:hypothetical protein ARAM_000839 [Aspergillus rambellii]|uniref:Uncharacterized protein n=1 Tax=Aspergillus rambellii TaxID=308745 RepID=A0A0F8W767_9EURO|nr:hypothetical protein ARAM_000839 [Aspergillus rambellii]
MAGEEDSNRNKNPPPPPPPPPPSSSPPNRPFPDDGKPFDALRRFADEQISSMLQSVMGIPSLVSPPRTDHWPIFTEEQNYQDAQQRHRQEQSNDLKERSDSSSNPESQGPTRPGNYSADSSRARWSEFETPAPTRGRPSDMFDIDMFFDSFFDRFWFDDYVSSRFFHPYARPPFSNVLSANSAAWPVPYLMFSPYSPLHLERQAHYHSHRDRGVFSSLMTSLSLSSECDPEEPQWREAFEDLLRLENGKPMLDREPGVTTKPESGKEWLHSLVKRGSLGDHWKYVAGTEAQPWSTITFERPERVQDRPYQPQGEDLRASAKTEVLADEAESEPLTELDLYERFLSDIEARERDFFHGTHESPMLRLLLHDRRRCQDEREHDDDTENWLELVSGGNKSSVPDFVQESSSEAPAATPTPEDSYVVSTQISTERVRLPDGSIQTKTVNTKRFADGREETNESTEVVNPPRRDQTSPDKQETMATEQKKNGWFWKE